MDIDLDPNSRPTISVDEAAIVLGIARSSAYQAAKAGELPVVHFGRRMRVPTAALRRMLQLDDLSPVELIAADMLASPGDVPAQPVVAEGADRGVSPPASRDGPRIAHDRRHQSSALQRRNRFA